MSSHKRNNLYEQLIEIIELICKTGLKGLSQDEMVELSKNRRGEIFSKFQMSCFKGWKEAQEKILIMQLGLYPLAVEGHGFARYIYQNTQRLMDVIVWNMFGGGDYTDIKRLYNWEAKISNLKEHNILTHHRAANNINKDSHKFALIADLTSGLRIGDLMVSEVGKRPLFAEIKEGSVNSDLLEVIKNNKENIKETIRDPKRLKQAQRLIKQEERAKNALELLHTNSGVEDRFPGKKYEIHLLDKPHETFFKEMGILLSTVNIEGGVREVIIEDCLQLVCVKANSEGHFDHELVNNTLLAFGERNCGISFDWIEALNNSSIFKPIFLQPLPESIIQALVCREIALVMNFSFEKFAKKFHTEEFKVFTVSGKKKNKVLGRFRGAGGFGVSNKNIALVYESHGKNPEVFSDGIFGRIPSFCITPSYYYFMQKSMADRINSNSRENEKINIQSSDSYKS